MNRLTLSTTRPRLRVARLLLGLALAVGATACMPLEGEEDPKPGERTAKVTVANFGAAFGAYSFAAFPELSYEERLFAEDVAPGEHVAGVAMPAGVDLSFPSHVFELNPGWDYTLIRQPDSTLRLMIDHMGQTDPSRAYVRFMFLRYRGGSSLRRFSNEVDGRALEIPWDDFVDVAPGATDFELHATQGQFDSPLYDLETELSLEPAHYYTLVVYPAASELNTDDPQYRLAVLRHGRGKR